MHRKEQTLYVAKLIRIEEQSKRMAALGEVQPTLIIDRGDEECPKPIRCELQGKLSIARRHHYHHGVLPQYMRYELRGRYAIAVGEMQTIGQIAERSSREEVVTATGYWPELPS